VADTAATVTDDGEGGAFVSFGAPHHEKPSDHDANLAETLDQTVLDGIASDLLRQIEDDDTSRREWLAMREQALGLLGLRVNPPRTDTSSGAAPFEGMSSYQDGALLEACVRGQANARGELLPADGPVKVHNDGMQIAIADAQAEALEKAVNRFLTVTSTEYVPDSDRLFFQVYWSGLGYKKAYHCPIRRRPVLDAIDAKDVIVSAQAADLDTAARVTHVIKMGKATLARMQLAGAYVKADLSSPVEEKTVVDKKLETLQGVQRKTLEPKLSERLIYECYADYEVPGDESDDLPGVPLPYKFTIDKSSRKVLEVRRNWREDDAQCFKRKVFIAYPLIPAFGYYPLGLMNLMGNTVNGITAALRIMIDNGMFGNFPAFLYAKTGTGQDKNDFRAGPGQGIPVNAGPGEDLAKRFIPIPAKPIDTVFMQLIQSMKADVQRIGGTADNSVGEGNQNAPVGTTVALIEQADKIMSAVHKRLHQAQAEEFRVLRELLQEDPDALWRQTGVEPFNKDVIVQALNNYELIPQADPNVSSHVMRLSRAEAARGIVKDGPQLWDVRSALEWYCDQIGIPELKRFLLPPAPPQQPGAQPQPDAMKSVAMLRTQEMKSQDALQDRMLKAAELQQKSQDAAADREERATEHRLNLAKEAMIHPLSPEIINQTGTPQ